MINEQCGVMMYGPQRWAAIKAANGQQLGWSWGGIWDGIKSIGSWGLDTFIKSQETGVYKDVAAAAVLQQQQTTKTIMTAAAVIGVGLVLASVIKGN